MGDEAEEGMEERALWPGCAEGGKSRRSAGQSFGETKEELTLQPFYVHAPLTCTPRLLSVFSVGGLVVFLDAVLGIGPFRACTERGAASCSPQLAPEGRHVETARSLMEVWE